MDDRKMSPVVVCFRNEKRNRAVFVKSGYGFQCFREFR
jgi:hypothetical protein